MMSTLTVISTHRTHEVQPSLLEAALLRGARMLERAIERRVAARAEGAQAYEQAAAAHRHQRAEATSAGHLGLLPRGSSTR